jgi:hypothetical protein
VPVVSVVWIICFWSVLPEACVAWDQCCVVNVPRFKCCLRSVLPQITVA